MAVVLNMVVSVYKRQSLPNTLFLINIRAPLLNINKRPLSVASLCCVQHLFTTILCIRELRGAGDSGITAGMGTTFTVIPRDGGCLTVTP